MVKIFWLLSSLSFFSIVSRISPLTFDPFTREIIEEKNSSLYYRFVSANPAIAENEEKACSEYSLDKKALFVRGYNKEYKYELMSDRNPDLSVVYHATGKENLIEIGYEVYYNEERNHERFSTSVYNEFTSLKTATSKTRSWLNGWFTDYPTIEEFYPHLIDMFNSGIYDERLGFIWIRVIAVKFDLPSWSVLSLSYEIGSNNRRLFPKCDSDALSHIYGRKNLVDEYYASTLDKLYSSKNQNKILQDVALPSTLGEDCRIHYNCLKKYNISPYEFQPSELKYPCSDLISIPIWYELNEQQLKNLNYLLPLIAQETNGKFDVKDGVLEPIKFSSKNEDEIIYLYPEEKKLSIPSIIFKLVVYKTYDCDTRKRLCWFGVIIVIHNNPLSPPENPVCDDVCEEWGWKSIRYGKTSNARSKNVYCCPINKSTISNLGFEWGENIIYRDLRLNNFPTYDGTARKHEYKDLQAKFEKKIMSLLPTSDRVLLEAKL